MELKRHRIFINDFKKLKLLDSQFAKFIKYINMLCEDLLLPCEARDHELLGEYRGFREFHLGGDMLVIHHRDDSVITLARIGTHSQLFKQASTLYRTPQSDLVPPLLPYT
jgi:mRNA interferase YafQ